MEVSSILAHEYGAMSRENAASAVKALRNALASAARYKGFVRYLSGTEKKVRLENDVLAVDVSNHGGAIVNAILKDYQRYDSTAVDVMGGEANSYSFTLTTATQRFDTGEFYFTPTAVTDSSVTMQLDLGDGAMWGIRYTLPAEGYTLRMEIVQSGMQAVIPPVWHLWISTGTIRWPEMRRDVCLRSAIRHSIICLPMVI